MIASVSILTLFIYFVFCEDAKNAKILEYKNYNGNPNNYYFRFETSNGIFREESGKIVISESNEEVMVVHGKYSHEGHDNLMYIVEYTADDKGYRIEKIKEVVRPKDEGTSLGNRISSNAVKSLQGGGIG